jgi:type VI secretion system Hcp family effector
MPNLGMLLPVTSFHRLILFAEINTQIMEITTKNLQLFISSAFIFFIIHSSYSQNMGVGVQTPSEKLEVDGIVFSSSGGIMFPDSTLQVSAASNSTFEAAADNRQYILMQINDNTIDIEGPDSAFHISNAMKVLNFEFSHFNTNGPAQFDRLHLEKQIDKASIPIMDAFHNGFNLEEVTLHFFRKTAVNNFERYYIITLYDAHLIVVNQSIVYSQNCWAHIEALDFAYERIKFEHLPTNTSFQYDFNNP